MWLKVRTDVIETVQMVPSACDKLKYIVKAFWIWLPNCMSSSHWYILHIIYVICSCHGNIFGIEACDQVLF